MSKTKLPQFKEPITPAEVFLEWARDLEQLEIRSGRKVSEMKGLFYVLAVAARTESGHQYIAGGVLRGLNDYVDLLIIRPIISAQLNEAKIVKALLLQIAEASNN